MAGNFILTQGATKTIDVILLNSKEDVITEYDGSQPLTTTVWPGGDHAPILSPATLWNTPAEGTITITIDGADTLLVDPGRYQLLTRIDDAGAMVDAFECTIEVMQGPGTAAPLKTYCSFADLLDSAPWLEKLQRDSDIAGFAKQRNMARKWFDDLLQRHYRGGSGLSPDFAFIPGISFGGQGWSYRDGRRSRELQAWLDADGLDVTDPVIEAVTCYAIALLCDRQVTPSKEDAGYADKASQLYRQAESAVQDITAEVDTNGDGVNDIAIRMGIADTLEG